METGSVEYGTPTPYARCVVWLAVGLWVLVMPASVGARPLCRVSPVAAAFLLAWLLAAYAATSVASIAYIPPLAQYAACPLQKFIAVVVEAPSLQHSVS